MNYEEDYNFRELYMQVEISFNFDLKECYCL